MIAVVLCTGPSLTQADVDYCRGKAFVVAVSNAIELAPWADALVAYDRGWWAEHQPTYAGPRYHSHAEKIEGGERVVRGGGNSGCLGLLIAARQQPEKIILLGADLKGTHFFGPHKKLRNTQPHQFKTMKNQYAALKHLPVVNCSPDSELECFRKSSLRVELADVLQLTAA